MITSRPCIGLSIVPAVILTACGGESPTAPNLSIALVSPAPTTAAGESAGDSVRVRVMAGGSPRSGIIVTFTVAAGGGSISPSTATTDAQGRAATRFITGTKVGANSVTASIRETTSPATLSFTTVAGPAKSVSFSQHVYVVDLGQRITPTLTAVDVNGNPVTFAQLTYVSRSADIALAASDGSISAARQGQATVVAGSALGGDSLIVIVATPGGPVLQSDLTHLDVPRETTLTLPIVLDMRTSSDKLGAATVTVRWDPLQLEFVSQAEGSSGVGALVNATNAAQGTMTIALASVTGFGGRVELRRVTFRSTASVGRAAKLALTTSQVSAAGTFADLLPKTVSVTYPLVLR